MANDLFPYVHSYIARIKKIEEKVYLAIGLTSTKKGIYITKLFPIVI